ncbi:MAG: AAA family ATPase [Deltaproteobacteria bacterium]
MSALLKSDLSPFGTLRVATPVDVPEPVREAVDPRQERDQKWQALQPIDIDRAAFSNPLLVARDSGRRAIPFDGLATKLAAQASVKGWKRIAITSATAGVGKTTLVANLALAFARASDQKVLICEMNQRNPSLASLFAVNPRRDISEVLFDDLDFATQGHRLQSAVAMAFSQQRQRGVFDMHPPRAVHDALAKLTESFQPDLVLYDLPHIYGDDATFGFLAGVDCALAVARQDQSLMSELDGCERDIATQTAFAGFIVTQSRQLT